MGFRTTSSSPGISLENDRMFINSADISGVGYDDSTLPTNVVKITASDVAAGDNFGNSVAVGFGRIVVGSNSDDDAGSASGSAYIFDLEGNELAKITASDAAAGDQFGVSVAVGSGRIVVGAYQDDDNGSSSGSAYIYDLDGNELKKITASDGAADDYFGWSISVGCGRIVVGSYRDDDNGPNSGSAYIFDLDGNQLAKLSESDGDFFGYSVAVGCGRIVVGAYFDDDNGVQAGAAYLYDLDGNKLTKIKASDGSQYANFGDSASIRGGRILISAPRETQNGSSAGAIYTYDLDGNELSKIVPSDNASSDFFGYDAAVANGRMVSGAPGDGDNGSYSGSLYVYDLDGNQLTKITATDGAANDFFGISVAAGSGRIVVGASGDDNNGSAYIYTIPDQTHALDIFDD